MKNIKVRSLIAVLISLLLLSPALALAETVVRTGDSVSINANQTVENNLYAAGGNVSNTGEVKGDMYVAAGSVTVNGAVKEDLTAFGGTTQIHAPIGGDVRVAGGDIVVADKVGGDIFVMGGHLQLLSSAEVKGNIYFYGGQAEVDGIVDGSVMGRADSYTVNGSVGGVNVTAKQVALGDQAVVRGDISYQSDNELDRAPGATVTGSISKNGAEVAAPEKSGIASWLFVLAWSFSSLVVFLFFKSGLEKMLITLRKEPIHAGLYGAAAVLAGPILSLVLIFTVLGAWIGLLMLLAIIILILAGLILLPILLGGYLLALYHKKNSIDLWSVVFGLFVLLALFKLPVIGGLLILFGVFFGAGTLLLRLYNAGHS